MAKVLSVKYQSEGSYRGSFKTYDYLYTGNNVVEKDDIAIVNAVYGEKIQVVHIVAVRDAAEIDMDLKKVIEVVSFAEQREVARKAKLKKELTDKLKKRVKEQAEKFTFETVAAKDPVAAELLRQLSALDG